MKSILCLVLFVIVSVSLATAQGTYTQIDVPGGTDTNATAINASGDIVGFYEVGGHERGFSLSAGVFTSIDYPRAVNTQLLGVNDVGEIVGYSYLPPNLQAAFIYDPQNGTFTDIKIHGASYVLPFAINNAGTVAGYVGGLNGTSIGFKWVGVGRTQEVLVRGVDSTEVFGITSTGEVVGLFTQGTSIVNFAYENGSFAELTVPNASAATVRGINPAGTALLGNYIDVSTGAEVGFVYQGGILTVISFPGSQQTTALGLNSNGQVVGSFLSNGQGHGFLWTPPTDLVRNDASR